MLERCTRENGNPLQYSCLKNFMNRRAWWLWVTRNQTAEWLRLHTYPLWRTVYSSPLPSFCLCPKACRILFPHQRFNLRPGPWQWKFRVLTTGLPGNPHLCSFLVKLFVPDSWGRKELDMTEWLNWTELVVLFCFWWVNVLDIKSLSSYRTCKYVLSFCKLSLYFLYNAL